MGGATPIKEWWEQLLKASYKHDIMIGRTFLKHSMIEREHELTKENVGVLLAISSIVILKNKNKIQGKD